MEPDLDSGSLLSLSFRMVLGGDLGSGFSPEQLLLTQTCASVISQYSSAGNTCTDPKSRTYKDKHVSQRLPGNWLAPVDLAKAGQRHQILPHLCAAGTHIPRHGRAGWQEASN